MNSFFRYLIFFLILFSGIAVLAIYWTFYRPLPDYQTTIEQPQLNQPVDIHWDNHGVPHIYANNEHDLYYSLGYAHAQDRLWQMTLNQMAAEGRFAEFFGKDLLPYDKLQRTLGFWRIAQRIEAKLSATIKEKLQAYADGVNAYAEENPKSLPIQFSLVEIEPITWTITHSIALSRLMAWELNLAWKSELTYAYLSEHLTSQQFNELLPNNNFVTHTPADDSTSWPSALMPLLQKNEEFNKLMGKQGSHVGSNAWAVSAEKSSSGTSLLAGDPHLGLNMPGKWYEVHLNIDGKNLSGATLPGAPTVVLGQNDHLAWSLTNIMLDDTDFYREAVNPQNNNEYVLDSLAGDPLYEEFEIQEEVIKIKNADDTVFTRRLTNHGPVISDVFPEQAFIDDQVITMKWTGHEVTNEVEALYTINWAQSFDEFLQGVQKFKVPGQHFIYADRSGNIARLSAANVPIREPNPVVLRDGWDPTQNWQGYLSYDQLPANINPDRGWVANANNPPVGDDYPHYISIYWEPDARYDRIRQYLQQENVQFSPHIFQQMQTDATSFYAQDLTETILPVLKNSDRYNYQTVISYLENWDYSYEQSETAASIMDVFMLELSANTFEDELGSAAYENFVRFSALPARALMRFLEDRSTFFDNVETTDTETRNEIIVQSMNETIRFLERNYGEEPFEWRWEQLHTITLKPLLLGEAAEGSDAPQSLKLIVNNLLSSGPHAVPGHDMTINNGEYDWNDPFEMVLGPSIRRIVDFSDLSRTWSITPTGQSGNPLSQYYGDQTESWLEGQYKFLYQDSTFFNENQYRTMKLIPAK